MVETNNEYDSIVYDVDTFTLQKNLFGGRQPATCDENPHTLKTPLYIYNFHN